MGNATKRTTVVTATTGRKEVTTAKDKGRDRYYREERSDHCHICRFFPLCSGGHDFVTLRYGHMNAVTVRYGHMNAVTVRYGHMHAVTVRYGHMHAVTVRYGHMHAVTVWYGHMQAATEVLKQSNRENVAHEKAARIQQ